MAVQILVGDPKQLQASSEFFNTHVPRCQGGLKEDLQYHSRSTMERLSRGAHSAFAPGGSHSSMLTTQYRMHADVCHVVSEHFYRCALLPSTDFVDAFNSIVLAFLRLCHRCRRVIFVECRHTFLYPPMTAHCTRCTASVSLQGK